MKNMKPRAPSFWPPTKVFTQPETECLKVSAKHMLQTQIVYAWTLQYKKATVFGTFSKNFISYQHVLTFSF